MKKPIFQNAKEGAAIMTASRQLSNKDLFEVLDRWRNEEDYQLLDVILDLYAAGYNQGYRAAVSEQKRAKNPRK